MASVTQMLKIMRNNIRNTYWVFLNILLIVYHFYIFLYVFVEKVIVADDLKEVYNSKEISTSYLNYIYSYLDSSTMAARPVSGFITGTLVFLSKYHESVYLLGLLFFPLSLVILYFVIKKILSKELASLITLLYSCSLIGTSIQFSPIMLNSNVATIFFSLSIYCLYVHKKLLISSLFFIASVLSYEIFLPLILLNLLLIKENKKRILFLLFTLGTFVIFRKVIQPGIFVHSYQRDEVGKIFEFKRIIQIAVYSLKLFFKDIFVGIYKGLANLKHLHIAEIILSLTISALVYKVFSEYNLKNRLNDLKKLALISLISILLGLSVFLFSSYIPTLFGFDNRNLGAVRLFYTLFIVCGITFLSDRLRLGNKTTGFVFAVIVFLFVTTNISVKNSWVYASRFNNILFRQLNMALKENHIENGVVCLKYDMFRELKTNPRFILREPIFYNNWECRMLSKMNGIDPKKLRVYNADRKTNCEVIFYYKDQKMIRTK